MTSINDVRKRAGMYIGNTDDGSGLNNMAREVVSFAIRDVVRAGSGRIDVHLKPDGVCVVMDNGWGLSAQSVIGLTGSVEVLTDLHSKEAFLLEAAWSGHGGVGLCVVNALSEWLVVRIRRDGQEHSMRFRKGVSEAPLTYVGPSQNQGTEISFRPDPEFFSDIPVSLGPLVAWLRAVDLPDAPMTFTLKSAEGAEVILNCAGGSII